MCGEEKVEQQEPNKIIFRMCKEEDDFKHSEYIFGHSIHRKPTCTDLHLQASSCHHPVQTIGVLKTLVHQIRSLSDPGNLTKELEHLQSVFHRNGYSSGDIEKVLCPISLPEESADVQEETVAFLPYDRPVSVKISRILLKYNFKSIFCPPPKIKVLLQSVKDDLDQLTVTGYLPHTIPVC